MKNLLAVQFRFKFLLSCAKVSCCFKFCCHLVDIVVNRPPRSWSIGFDSLVESDQKLVFTASLLDMKH